MSMDRFIGGMLSHSQGLVDALAQARIAVVTGWDAEDLTAKCTIQPEGINIGWLPVQALSLGPNSYALAAPVIGSQVIVVPQEASPNSYMILCAVPNTDMPITSRPEAIEGEPVKLAEGEFIVTNEDVVFRVGKTKVFLKGDFEIEGNITHKGDYEQDGQHHLTGDLISDADVEDNHGTLDGLRQHYNSHKHSGVTTGGGLTGNTNVTD